MGSPPGSSHRRIRRVRHRSMVHGTLSRCWSPWWFAACCSTGAICERTEPPMSMPLPAMQAPTVEVTNLAKWYGDVVAVADVSFQLGPGVTGLLGPNGAGKSTTFKMLTGLLRPSAGSISILGRPARGDVGLYRQIGLVGEQEATYSFLSGYEFV